MTNLAAAAYELCEEIRDGRWADALRHAPNDQPAASVEIIEVLRRRCPGHTTEAYQAAIAKGMVATR